MEGMEVISFKMIAAIGEAKSRIMHAMDLANERKIEEAKKMLESSNEKIVEAHHQHFDLIQKEANGEKVEIGLLFLHAEDQLMTTALLKDMAAQMIRMYETMYALTI
jgi:PTS system cellobiose-specific IIA component